MLCMLCVLWGVLTYVLLALAGTATAERLSKQWRALTHACAVRWVPCFSLCGHLEMIRTLLNDL